MAKYRSVKVAIIDRDRIFRESLLGMLGTRSGVVGAGCASTPTLFNSLVIPDVFLVHCCSSSLGEIRDLGSRFPGAKFVAIRVDLEEADLLECIRSGIVGFILLDADRDEIIATVRMIERGEIVVPGPAVQVLFSQLNHREGTSKSKLEAFDTSKLTIRERQIFNLLIDGFFSNKEIATQLGIETATVKTHVHSIFSKLRIRSRVELARKSSYLHDIHMLQKNSMAAAIATASRHRP